MATVNTIFELLTAENPVVHEDSGGRGNTKSRFNYYTPKQVVPWDEFNFETFKEMYKGEVEKQARQEGRLLHPYPFIADIDRTVRDEPTTTSLLTKWSQTLVNQALYAVCETLHPCIWKQGKTKLKGCKLTPDAGAVSPCKECREVSVERLPKDYKTATKWKSQNLINEEFLNKNGEWRGSQFNKDEAMPLRQVYTYCVRYLCRYGCIVTSHEAFIFRIKPRTRPECRSSYCYIPTKTSFPRLNYYGSHQRFRARSQAKPENRWTSGISLGSVEFWADWRLGVL